MNEQKRYSDNYQIKGVFVGGRYEEVDDINVSFRSYIKCNTNKK